METLMRPLHLVLAAVVLVVSGVAVTIALACPPRRPPPPPPPMEGPRGRISITTTPGAQVSIDGQRLGPTPLIGHYLDPGNHRVRLRASCGTWAERVYVPPSGDVNLAIAVCPGARVPAK
jgi:hypothetical protein